MGFDNLDFAEFTDPALTTVHQPGYQLGATAARLLLERIDGSKQRMKKVVLSTELKVRHSAAPPRESRPGSATETVVRSEGWRELTSLEFLVFFPS